MKIKPNNFIRALGKNIEIKLFNDAGYALFYEGYWYSEEEGWNKEEAFIFSNKDKAENYIVDNLIQIYKELSYAIS